MTSSLLEATEKRSMQAEKAKENLLSEAPPAKSGRSGRWSKSSDGGPLKAAIKPC